MQKTYSIKLYSKTDTFIKTIWYRFIMSEIQFRSAINGWQWELIIDLSLPITDTSFDDAFVARIYCDDWIYNISNMIYRWVIVKVKRIIRDWVQIISVTMLWLSYLLNRIYYLNGVDHVFTKTQEPMLTMAEAIADVNTYYNFFSIPVGNAPYYWSSVAIEFDKTYANDVLTKIGGIIQRGYYINQNGEIFFKEKPSSPTHEMTLGKEVDEIEYEIDREDIRNSVAGEYSFETNPQPWVTQTNYAISSWQDNNPSSNVYGVAQLIVESDVKDSPSAAVVAQQVLARKKDPIKVSRLVVNSNYNIESIKPWDTITIKNCPVAIENVQVYSASYSPYKVSIEIEKLENIWQFTS